MLLLFFIGGGVMPKTAGSRNQLRYQLNQFFIRKMFVTFVWISCLHALQMNLAINSVSLIAHAIIYAFLLLSLLVSVYHAQRLCAEWTASESGAFRKNLKHLLWPVLSFLVIAFGAAKFFFLQGISADIVQATFILCCALTLFIHVQMDKFLTYHEHGEAWSGQPQSYPGYQRFFSLLTVLLTVYAMMSLLPTFGVELPATVISTLLPAQLSVFIVPICYLVLFASFQFLTPKDLSSHPMPKSTTGSTDNKVKQHYLKKEQWILLKDMMYLNFPRVNEKQDPGKEKTSNL